MDWRSPRSQDGTQLPAGEYVVHHERPYPHRLDRAFRIGAIVVAVAIGFGAGWAIVALAPRIPEGLAGVAAVAVSALLAAVLAYGFTRAIGLIVTGIVGGLRRKAYVVDWEGDPPSR